METKAYKQTFKNLTSDLKGIKKAEFKETIFNIIYKFHLEIRENGEDFREAFLSNKADKYFNEIKKAIGEFKGISKMRVLDFLARVVLGYGFKENKLFQELHEEFLKRRAEFRLNYEISKG